MTWKDRPFNQIGKDPLKNNSKTENKESLSADSCKCPSCASNIFYEPELASMVCPNCGNVYSPDTLEPRGSLGVTKEHDYIGSGDMSEEDKRRHEIICNSCGAALVADENTMSTMCPFCGSPALITKRMSREFKPDYIIPFKIDKDRAESLMKQWLAEKKYTSAGFKAKLRMTHMTALYVPFWLVDCSVNSDISGTGIQGRGLMKDFYEVNSTITYYVKGVPFDASLQIPNKLMEACEPFDYSEMVRFESKYLQGFYANKYDQLPTEMTDRIVRRMEKFSRSTTDSLAGRYDRFEERSEKNITWLSDISVRYCLLPVWFVTIEYGGEKYQFAVNGQTGEACGRVPITKTVDVASNIRSIADSNWIFLPIALAIVFGGLLWYLTASSEVSPFKSFMVVLLTVLLVADLIALVLMEILKLSYGLFANISNKANEQTDYDKDPGLDCYLDSSRTPKRTLSETLLRHLIKVTDENGRVIDERSIEI